MHTATALQLGHRGNAAHRAQVLTALSVAALLAAQCAVVIASHAYNLRLQWISMGVLCAAGLACMLCICLRSDRAQITAATAIALALATRLIALAGAPLLDDDYFRFLWDGYVLLQGQSPYAAAPAEFFLRDDVPAAWHGVLSQVNHPDVPTVYGPALQLLFGAAVFIAGPHPFGLQVLWAVADLALIMTLLRCGVAPWQAALYAISPLVLKEVGHALHPDGLIAALLAGAVLLALAQRLRLAGVLLGVMIATKLPLALLALCFLAQRKGWVVVGTAMVTALLLYAPFVLGGAFGLEGLRTFGQQWRVNALAFSALEWWVPQQARAVAAALSIALTVACAVAVRKKILPLPLALLISLTGGLLLAPANNPWYWLALLPVALIAGRGQAWMPITPWAASVVVLSAYVNGHVLSVFEIETTLAYAQVHPFARALQAGVIGIALIYDAWRYTHGPMRGRP
jgi:alpha-1,6-mannosyltransferase